MGFDLSGVDAELDDLGREPDELITLARAYAASVFDVADLSEVDHALALLANDGPTETGPRSSDLPPAWTRAEPVYEAPNRRRSVVPEPPLRRAVSEKPVGRSEAPRAPSQPAAKAASEAPQRLSSEPPASQKPNTQRPASNWPTLSDPSAPFHFADTTVHSAPLTQSQEIALPDSVPSNTRDSTHDSGELALPPKAPTSGSFSLDADAEQPVPAYEARAETLLGSSPSRYSSPDFGAKSTQSERPEHDDVEDALLASAPRVLAPMPRPDSSLALDRDPDAEFDALLDDTEHAHGALGAIGTPEDEHEYEAELSDFEDEEDRTEVIDRGSLGNLEAMPHDEHTEHVSDEELEVHEVLEPSSHLDSGELEMVLEDDLSPSPTRPSQPGEPKRPSLLDRFFGRDRE